MTKNKTWAYASGGKPEPQHVDARAWKEEDDKAKVDLYLAVGDAELKQIKNCSMGNLAKTRVDLRIERIREESIIVKTTYESSTQRRAAMYSDTSMNSSTQSTSYPD